MNKELFHVGHSIALGKQNRASKSGDILPNEYLIWIAASEHRQSIEFRGLGLHCLAAVVFLVEPSDFRVFGFLLWLRRRKPNSLPL